ncbi:Protein kinase domain [Sesbania bispinosa]|nr:Protein kinase domain [Sesbania bispinosa]
MYNSCQNTTGKSLPTSYQTNVNNLLSWIASDSSKGNEYNHITIGNNNGHDDVVYGSYDCRGDITGYFCQFCLNTAAREIVQRCPNSVSAVIWYDICIIRYSNQSFLGKLSLTPSWNVTGSKSIKDSTEVGKAESNMESLIRKATIEANQSWAMGEFNWSDNEKRYGWVQCAKDLSNDGCRLCLEAMLDIVPKCCGTKVGWAVVAPSCGMKFDDYLFYQFNNQTESSSPMPNPAKQEGASNTKTLIITLVSVLVGVALLSYCIYFSCRRNGLCKDGLLLKTIPITFHDHVQREDSLKPDLPIIPFTVIQQSTNFFSETSKLGEGGFGPVYKGTLPDGTEIAVKRLAETSIQGLEEFKNE